MAGPAGCLTEESRIPLASNAWTPAASGFVVVADLSGGRTDTSSLRRPLSRLAHRGLAERVVDLGWCALGSRHRGPHREGAGAPVRVGRAWVTCDGRLDRTGQASVAGAGGREPRPVLQPTPGVLRELRGAFALAWIEPREQRVVLARDALGERTLYYALDGKRLLVASEEAALLALVSGSKVNQDTVLRYLALEPPEDGATFWSGIRELPPATMLTADATGVQSQRYWSPSASGPGRAGDDAAWMDAFRSRLAHAVTSRLEPGESPAVMLSGGLDSSACAAIAAVYGESKPVAYSWVFERFPRCDERRWIEAVVERYGLDSRQVVADALDPWCTAAGSEAATGLPLPSTLSRPETNPYRVLKQALYSQASSSGHHLLLSGASGDRLYAHSDRRALRSALAQGRLGLGVGELLRALRYDRHRAARLIAGVVAPRSAIRRRDLELHPWLRAKAIERLTESGYRATKTVSTKRDVLCGWRAAGGDALEARYAAAAGVEIRDPYRDRDLVELVLAMPDHLLFRAGRFKWVLRASLHDLLPERVRERAGSASLAPVFWAGLRRRVEATRRLLAEGTLWRSWLQEDWPLLALDRGVRDGLDHRMATALWMAISLSLWERTIVGKG